MIPDLFVIFLFKNPDHPTWSTEYRNNSRFSNKSKCNARRTNMNRCFTTEKCQTHFHKIYRYILYSDAHIHYLGKFQCIFALEQSQVITRLMKKKKISSYLHPCRIAPNSHICWCCLKKTVCFTFTPETFER